MIQPEPQVEHAGHDALLEAARAPRCFTADTPRLPIQAKLTVSDPGDPRELEADRIAERVVQRPASEIHASSPTANVAVQRKCISCEEDEGILRQPAAGASHVAITAPATVHESLSSPGHALDRETREFMEPRFGHDFSRVRVHVNDAATDSVNAHAFTVGHRIVFKTNQYRPGTESGRRLLAHELTHVVQQGAIGGGSASPGGAALARKPVDHHASGLLPPEKVQEVYGDWVQAFFKARRTTVMTEALDEEVRKTVKKQVGSGNFANWERWERAQQENIDSQVAAKNPKPSVSAVPGKLITDQGAQPPALPMAPASERAPRSAVDTKDQADLQGRIAPRDSSSESGYVGPSIPVDDVRDQSYGTGVWTGNPKIDGRTHFKNPFKLLISGLSENPEMATDAVLGMIDDALHDCAEDGDAACQAVIAAKSVAEKIAAIKKMFDEANEPLGVTPPSPPTDEFDSDVEKIREGVAESVPESTSLGTRGAGRGRVFPIEVDDSGKVIHAGVEEYDRTVANPSHQASIQEVLDMTKNGAFLKYEARMRPETSEAIRNRVQALVDYLNRTGKRLD